jgi:hypothetical protein
VTRPARGAVGDEAIRRALPYLEVESAAERVHRYFRGAFADHLPLFFSGASFERFGGGGDRAETADEITCDDLVAVTMLSVEVPAHAALAILDDEEIPNALSDPRTKSRLDQVDDIAALHDRSHPLMRLWNAVLRPGDHRLGVGPTTASKLLARKRPQLVPVFDSVVGAALGGIDDHWRRVHAIVREPETVDRLQAIRDGAAVGEDISLLRVLDVAIWMKDLGDDQWARAVSEGRRPLVR